MSNMKDSASNVNHRIAARVRGLRSAHGLSLDGLAGKSGVSRSMLSLIERGESSPTAVILEKLAAGLHVTLASLFDVPAAGTESPTGPVTRREEQPKRYTALQLHFTIAGAGADETKARRAIDLSLEKYCSVVASLAPDIPVTYDVTLR